MTTNGIPNNPGERVLDAALKAVAKTAGLEGQIERVYAITHDYGTDAIVNFAFEHKMHRYAVEIRAVDRIDRLGLIRMEYKGGLEGKLLVAPYITAELAEHCRTQGIQFIDTAGNAYLKAKGMHVFITGHKRNLNDMPAAKDRATTTTGMRVVFALLCKPELLNAAYRDIAAAAGVALGTVGWVFFALQNRGHLLIAKQKKRQFVDIKRVIEEWARNYPVRLKPKLAAQRFHAPTPDWWKNTQLEKYAALFGGEVAGDVLTKYRPPGEVLIYADGDPARIIIDNHLKAAHNGEVEILEKFWHFELETKENRIVPPLLVYADLMATQDARNHEVAKLIYERYLINA
jgi:hypothetical protein